MHVLITGATGFVGRRLCHALHRDGHQVSAVSRSRDRTRNAMPDLAEVYPYDSDLSVPQAALETADAVVHLAGESIGGKWTPAKKAAIMESRTQGTRALVDGIADLNGPKPHLISTSAVGYYGDRGDTALTEDAPPGDDFLAQVCLAWEREARHAEASGAPTTIFRVGMVLGHDGGALEKMWTVFSLGAGGPLGSGLQYWPWVDIHDVVRALQFSLDRPDLQGVFNLTAPHPARQKAFSRALGRALCRPALAPAPSLILRLFLGEFSSEVLASRRAVPQRLLDVGFTFEYPDLEEALEKAIRQRRGDIR